MGDQGDKTEEPTPHKLREAAKKGQVVKSREITTAFLFFASYYVLAWSLPYMWKSVTNFFLLTFSMISHDIEFAQVLRILKELLMVMLLTLMPLMLTNVIIAIIVESLQSGFNMSIEPLMPKLNKLNPLEGFKRIFSLKGLVELAKSIAKMGIIFYIMYKALLPVMPILLRSGGLPILAAIALTGDIAMKVAIRVGMFYAFIAILDYFWQRQQFMKQMRMTKQEVKDEYKKLEGDPMVKQRQRDMARSLSSGRRGGGVAGADAVVTNPTHIAIALKYDSDTMQAPQVVAKGKLLIAEEIKRIAEENNIFITENKELAWALYNAVDINQEITPELYTEVAGILALVYEIRNKRKKAA